MAIREVLRTRPSKSQRPWQGHFLAAVSHCLDALDALHSPVESAGRMASQDKHEMSIG